MPVLDFNRKPIIGMVHAGPLPGSARDAGDLSKTIEAAVCDAVALAEGGVDALMVENFFDAPFCKDNVPPETVASMTALALAIRAETPLPLGINVLRNDVCAAIAVAHAAGAQFVRCNVYVGAAVTDQGIIEGAARAALEARRRIGARVEIWADVGVKHSVSLGGTPLAEQARDALERGLADALIVTGAATGAAAALDHLRLVKAAAGAAPVLLGSGVNATNAAEMLAAADGAIVGSALKRAGIRSAVDPARVRALLAAVASLSP